MESRKSALTIYISVAILTAFVFMTMIRNETWRSEKALWEDSVLKSPDSPVGWLNLAREYHRSGNRQKAVELYQNAMSLASMRNDFRSRDVLALAQANMGALLVRDGDKHDREIGIQALKSSMSLFPFYGPSVLWLSQTMNEDGKFSETITLIDAALANGFGGGFSEVGKLYFNKAVALCANGFIKPANDNFKTAFTLDRDIQPVECGQRSL